MAKFGCLVSVVIKMSVELFYLVKKPKGSDALF